MVTLILLLILFILFIVNTPIGIAIGVSSLAVFSIKSDLSPLIFIQRLYAGVDSFPLLAVPLFMYAGFIMEAGGISKRIVEFAEALVGWIPGGLAAVCVISAMFFGGISGSAAADTAAVGSILIPAMVKRGYRTEFANAIVAASGSLGVIIPPSIPMIIFGFLTGASISKLFIAGIIPGILIGFSLMTVSLVILWREGMREGSRFSMRRLGETFWRAKWALATPIVILSGILGGVFTATEAASIATLYAIFVGVVIHKELSLGDLPSLFIKGSITASVVLFIISCASVFSWIMAIEKIPLMVAHWIFEITKDPILLLLIMNVVLIVLGTFLETTASLILFVPLFMQIFPQLGIDIVQFGVIIVLNLAIGMLTPPLGICLIVACSISGARIEPTVRAIVPFIGFIMLNLLLVTYWSPVSMWLPSFLK
ncbi:MAG: TRAP transporter large permease [Syntrophobacterales bacterium]|nr:TRAP transporter large permease [Syntrophobacterales bacterium]